MKKVLSLLLAVIMVASLVPMTAFAKTKKDTIVTASIEESSINVGESFTATITLTDTNNKYVGGAVEVRIGSKSGTKISTAMFKNNMTKAEQTFSTSEKITVPGKYDIYFYHKEDGDTNQSLTSVPLQVGKVATPTASVAEGIYTSAQEVELSTTVDENHVVGDAIYYTTDGTDPTTSSAKYESAIPVNETTTIKAIAVKDGWENSEVFEATYTITGYTITNGTPESAKEENHGYITVDETAAEGETVTVTVTADEGYALKTLKYNDGTDHDITKDATTGEYQFTMPAKAVTVTAEFEKIPVRRKETTVTIGGNKEKTKADEKAEENPDTGAPVMSFGAVAVVLGAAVILSKKLR